MSKRSKSTEEVQSVLSIVEQYYEEWLDNDERMKSGYDYEATFVDMLQQMGKEVFQESLGKVSTNRKSKKNFKPH